MYHDANDREMVRITRLISAIHRMQENILDRYAHSRWDLTSGQLRLVTALLPGHPLRTLELARRLYTDPGTVSGLLRRLIQKGLIVCRHLSEDRRVQLVALTPRGEEIRRQYFDDAARDLPTSTFARHLPLAEQDHLLNTLVRYAAHLVGDQDVHEFLAKVDESMELPAPV